MLYLYWTKLESVLTKARGTILVWNILSTVVMRLANVVSRQWVELGKEVITPSFGLQEELMTIIFLSL